MSLVSSSGRELDTSMGPVVRMEEAPEAARILVRVVLGLMRRLLVLVLVLGPASVPASDMVPYAAMAPVDYRCLGRALW